MDSYQHLPVPRPHGGYAGAARASVPILIVDDNASKRLALKSVLLPLGYDIVEADSGLAALRCLMVQDFAVILLDVQMPDMDGFETAALIRLRPQSEMTPIIFVTAFQSDEVKTSDRYAEGAVDFLFAPVPPDELRAKVSVFANLFLKAEELAARAREVQTRADRLDLLTDTAPIGIFQTDTRTDTSTPTRGGARSPGSRPRTPPDGDGSPSSDRGTGASSLRSPTHRRIPRS